jgi:hypothetical protein
MAKPRLTRDQHADIGRALAAISDELTHRTAQLGNAYPRTGPEALPARKLAAAGRALNGTRSALDSALFREHPETAETTVYYPHPEDRATVVGTLRPRGTMRGAMSATVPCPVCSADASYFRELDRYVHRDGSDNFPCWLAIGRGESP